MSIKDRVIFGSPKKNRHQNSIDQVASVYFTQESSICIQWRVNQCAQEPFWSKKVNKGKEQIARYFVSEPRSQAETGSNQSAYRTYGEHDVVLTFRAAHFFQV